jgi:hypothetical protein
MTMSLVGDTTLRRRSVSQSSVAQMRGPLADSTSADFPEGRFLPSPDQAKRYRDLVRHGYLVMRNRRVVICGVARDAGEVLPLTIARMERLGVLFADYRVVIYENDSQDNTLDLLGQWMSRNWRVTVFTETRNDPPSFPLRCPHRGDRMAYYRNQYRDHVEARYQHFDNVLVADTDLVGGWSYDGIAHSYSQPNWDFMGSLGVIYRRIGWNPNCIHQYDAWAFRLDDTYSALTTKEVNNMSWQRGEPLVSVTSCFGGLGIYRLTAFLSGRYQGGDCEHIGLHRSMRANGYSRVFLNPSQIALYGRKRRRMDRWVSRCQNILGQSRLVRVPTWL